MNSLLMNQAIPVPSNSTARDCLQAIQYVLEAKRNADALLPTFKGQLPRQIAPLPGPIFKPMGHWLLDAFHHFTTRASKAHL